MHSILLSIEYPTGGDEAVKQWSHIANTLSSEAAKNKAVQVLAAGAWLFLGTDGLTALGSALGKVQEHKFSHHILLIEKATDWPTGNEQGSSGPLAKG